MVPLHGRTKDRFSEFWRSHLREATNPASVLNIVRIYLAAWSPEQLAALPSDVGALAIPSVEALMARAFLASRAELQMARDDPAHPLLEEMSLTLAVAADRIRALTTYPPSDLASVRELLSKAS
jgi:hypothetical protein